MLILPIQRIPRYEMLLWACRKQTPQNHPEYATLVEVNIACINPDLGKFTSFGHLVYSFLSQACSKMTSIATHINENKRHVENMDLIYSIQKSIKNLDRVLIQTFRHFTRMSDWTFLMLSAAPHLAPLLCVCACGHDMIP